MQLNQLDEIYLDQCRTAMRTEQEKSLAETNQWSHVDKPKVHADWDVLYKQLASVLDTSHPSDATIQELIDQHYQISSRFYVPSKLAYLGLALFYRENEAMRDFHNAYHPQMVAFLGDAIYVYTQQSRTFS
ncbi:MAG: TipAS antibiotic-recognition domain-containing protein [Burkholderiales bacterium]|nr:TipAS antibiotic-recognition domain-containing protein [Burkholderiales bacterium]